MDKEIEYRNIAYISGLFLIIGLFITISDPTKKALFDLLYDCVGLTTFTFVFLWLKRKIILCGLIVYLLSFNIDLLFNPLIKPDLEFLTGTLKTVGLIFNGIGLVCVLLGLWDNVRNKFWDKIDLKSNLVLLTIIISTGLIQLVLRLI